MTSRRSIHRIAGPLLVCGVLIPWPGQAQPQGSDVFSSSGQYDKFAVGAAHRWYDLHSPDVRQRSSDCLSILDEAKSYQERAFVLYEEARRPGLPNEQRTTLVKQGNEQIRLRGEKLRAFTDCVNHAIRQKGPLSDTFASNSESGGKGLKRVPGKPPKANSTPPPVTLDKAVDDCFAKSVPNYTSPDWSRFSPESLRPKRVGQFEQSFTVSGVAADQALNMDEQVYGKWNDRELLHDYLVGWLTRCLSQHKVLPMQDPRSPYAQLLRKEAQGRPQDTARQKERQDQFFYGYGSYPLPPFWNQDVAGPPAPQR